MKFVSYKFTVFILFVLTIVIIIFGVVYYESFLDSKFKLKQKTFENLLVEVNDIAKNIEKYNKKIYKDLKVYLKNHPDERDKYDMYLSSFLTHSYKNLFIVYKDKNSKFFRALADGTVNHKDRFDFNEKFEPKRLDKWEEVLKNKKPVYYSADIKGVWTTYLYPVLKNKQVDYIIVIDFSKMPLKMIEDNLQTLKALFVKFLLILIGTVLVLFVFIFYDIRRQKKMNELLNKVQQFNITLKKRVEEEVRKSREKDKQLILQSRMALMGELLSMIAHQWRQPLNVIGTIITNLEFDMKLGSVSENELKNSISKIKETIKHLSMTIDDFRKFYREDNIKAKVDIKSSIEEICRMIKPSLQSKGIELNLDINCDKNICLRKNEFKQVILNIVKNAEDVLVERKIKNPEILIKIFEEKGKCIVEIKDNGGGVDNSVKDKIFEPYFTTKDEKNGTGLGLYMSKIIVEKKLNGSIYEYNDKNGAVFRIELKVDDGCERDNKNY